MDELQKLIEQYKTETGNTAADMDGCWNDPFVRWLASCNEKTNKELEELQNAIKNYFWDEKDGTYSATSSRIGIEMHNGEDVVLVKAIRASQNKRKNKWIKTI